MQKYTKGFTLIELLVVIAIIGILSSVVLASLNTARGKGSDAAAKADIAGIRTQAEIVYDNAGGSYAAVCSDSQVIRAVSAAASTEGLSWSTTANNAGTSFASAVGCTNSAGAWASWISLLKGGANNIYCVDSTGDSYVKTLVAGTNSPTSCGASAGGAW